MAQILRPDADQSVGLWVDETSSSTGWLSLDEEISDEDGTYVEVETSSTSYQNGSYWLSDPEQGTPEDRSSGGHRVKFRWRAVAPSGGLKEDSGVVQFVLLEGAASVVDQLSILGVSSTSHGSYQVTTLTLSAAEAGSITDYSNLQVRLRAKSTGQAGGYVRIRVTQAWLEIPHTPLDPPKLSLAMSLFAPEATYRQYIDAPEALSTVGIPDSDRAVGNGWLDQDGGNSNIYSRVSHLAAHDDRYAEHSTVSVAYVNPLSVNLSGVDSEAGDTNKWRLRYIYRVASAGSVDHQIEIKESGSDYSVSREVVNDHRDRIKEGVFELTEAEASGYSALNDLYVDVMVRVSSVGLGGTVRLRLYAIWLEVGDGFPGVNVMTPAGVFITPVLTPPRITLSATLHSPEAVESRRVLRPPLINIGAHINQHLITGADSQLLGVVDDLQLFSSTQGGVEEGRMAMRELDGGETGLVEYWRFNTGTGVTVYGDNSHNGTLDGTSQWVGFEGSASIAGKRKPLVLGVRKQVKGTQVDGQRLVWQVHFGRTDEIIPTEGGHESLLYAGDESNIYDSVPSPGEYSTDLSRGLVRLGTDPVAPLAFNVRGDSPIDMGEDGFSAVGAVLLRRIVQRRAKVSQASIDFGALDLLAALRRGDMGFSTGSAAVTIATVMDRIMTTLDGWWNWTATGKLTASLRPVAIALSKVDFEITDDDLDDKGPRRERAAEVAKSWTVKFREYDVPIPSIDEVLGAVSSDDKFDRTQRWREARQSILDNGHEKHFPGAVDREIESLYDDVADARRDAWMKLQVDRYPKDVYSFPARHQTLRLQAKIGKSFRYTGRFANEGRVFVVVAIEVDPATQKLVIKGWTAPDHWISMATNDAVATSLIPSGVSVTGSAGRGEDESG